MSAERKIPVGLIRDPALAIRLARKRFARLAGLYESRGITVAWFKEYLLIQQPIGVLVIDCMAGEKVLIKKPGDFEKWKGSKDAKTP